MSSRPIRQPGPDHPITIERNAKRLLVRASGSQIADTRRALTLHEANYPAVQYIPRADVDMSQLRRSKHTSYCPYKGEANYFDVVSLGDVGANQVWTYEKPYPPVSEIAGHLAFYPTHARITEQGSGEA